MPYISKAEIYAITDLETFKKHFEIWVEREQMLISSLNAAIGYAGAEDMEIYQCLCSLVKEVKNECLRAEWVYKSLIDTNWEPHDVKVTSKWLHDYFECEYKGGYD